MAVDMEKEILYKQMCSRITLQNDPKGFFFTLCDTVGPLINVRDFVDCASDIDKIRFVLPYCWHAIRAEMIFRGKDLEEARIKKSEGNADFETGKFFNALQQYSQALIRCPVKSPGNDLAIIYSNRSALLHKTNEYQYAINDIELALNYNYPEDGRHKLYERMASCLISIKSYQKAKITLSLAKHFGEKYAPNDDKFNKKIQKLSDKLSQSPAADVDSQGTKEHIEGNQNGHHNCSFEIRDKNQEFPSATRKMEVIFSPNFGRYARAKEYASKQQNNSKKSSKNPSKMQNLSLEDQCGDDEIKTGDEILIETPFAAVLNLNAHGTHCLHCFKRLKSPIPCEICANVAFCSKSCRTKAEPYHQYECKILALLFGSGMSILCYLALRMITQTPLEKLLEKIPKLVSKPEEIVKPPEGVYDSSYESIYNLSALEFQREPKDFLERTIMAIFLAKCLRIVGYFKINIFKTPEPTEDEIQIASLLLRNLQVLQFNAYEINEFIMATNENFRKSTSKSIGIGIYSTASFFNHSCTPNVIRYFNGRTLFVKALRKIEPGEAICDNYGPLSTRMLRPERQHKLLGRYWFTCACPACTLDSPPLEKMPMDLEPKNKNQAKVLKRLKNLEELYYDKGFDLLDKGISSSPAAAEFFKKFLDESHEGAEEFKPYKTFYLAQEGLKLCMQASGSVFVREDLKINDNCTSNVKK